jgi:hypothetical protein
LGAASRASTSAKERRLVTRRRGHDHARRDADRAADEMPPRHPLEWTGRGCRDSPGRGLDGFVGSVGPRRRGESPGPTASSGLLPQAIACPVASTGGWGRAYRAPSGCAHWPADELACVWMHTTAWSRAGFRTEKVGGLDMSGLRYRRLSLRTPRAAPVASSASAPRRRGRTQLRDDSHHRVHGVAPRTGSRLRAS